jgi:predicted GIY-YIG superfamily endonuclease
LLTEPIVSAEKCFVYILQSESVPTRYSSGLASNVGDRIAAHNEGISPHTASGRPWRFVAAVEFANQERAAEFERYLKTGSGRAFAKRHLR